MLIRLLGCSYQVKLSRKNWNLNYKDETKAFLQESWEAEFDVKT